MRVAIDTNVLVSALIGPGRSRRLVVKLLEAHSVVSSKEMLAELADVLSRGKFIEVRSSQVDEFLSVLVSRSEFVTVKQRLRIVSEDPDDDIVLSTASEGRADYIVSGDKHLLKLKELKGIKIVMVKDMLEIMRRETG